MSTFILCPHALEGQQAPGWSKYAVNRNLLGQGSPRESRQHVGKRS